MNNYIRNLNFLENATILPILYKALDDLVFIMEYKDGGFYYYFMNERALYFLNLNEIPYEKTFHEVMNSQTADFLVGIYSDAILHRQTIEYNDEGIDHNGKTVYYESLLSPIMGEDGECKFVICVSRDVSERVRKSQQLLENKLRFQSLYDHNLDGILSLDISGKIISINKATLQMLNDAQSFDIIDKNIIDFLAEEEKEEFFNIYAKALIGKSSESKGISIVFNEIEFTAYLRIIPTVVHGEISGLYVVLRDITEQLEREESIRLLAYQDALTGIGNRVALMDKLKDKMNIHSKNYSPFTLLYCDLDRFKIMNDSYGHSTGDVLLKQVANRFQTIENATYNVYRQGGDEFIIILEEMDELKVNEFGEQIVQLFNQPFKLGEEEFYFSVSVGMSSFPKHTQNPLKLIKFADMALYHVKEKNKGSYAFYSQTMNIDSTQQLEIEGAMRKAIEKDEFEMYYQPQFLVNSKEVVSFEALIRWKHPEMGFISPADFIPLAENSGFIHNIGDWVLENVMKQIVDWEQKGYPSLPIAINVSSIQLQNPKFIMRLKQLLHEYKINPNKLELEVTERVMIEGSSAVDVLKEARDLGIRISIDDFGIGYSSLSYLKNLPLDSLKIDRTFIKELCRSPKDSFIAKMIADLANHLGLECIAEGVEEEEQLKVLQSLSCKIAQGFYFSHPVSTKEIEDKFLNKTPYFV